MNLPRIEILELFPCSPLAWRRRLQSKSSRRPCNFFRWCWNYAINYRVQKAPREDKPRPRIPRRLTITSFRSLVCRWCKGSSTFCLMLSSNEYLTSAICRRDSPNSINDCAATDDETHTRGRRGVITLHWSSAPASAPLTKDAVLAQLLAEHQHAVGEETLRLRVCIALGLPRQLRDPLHGRHLGPCRWVGLQVLFRFCLQLLDQLYGHVCFLFGREFKVFFNVKWVKARQVVLMRRTSL